MQHNLVAVVLLVVMHTTTCSCEHPCRGGRASLEGTFACAATCAPILPQAYGFKYHICVHSPARKLPSLRWHAAAALQLAGHRSRLRTLFSAKAAYLKHQSKLSLFLNQASRALYACACPMPIQMDTATH